MVFKKNQKNKEYDIIYSIGTNCSCAGTLKRFHLRNTSGPFDWVWRATFEQRFDCLMSDFKDFLNINDLQKVEKDLNNKMQNPTCDYYYNSKTGFQFVHDFPSNVDLQSAFPKVQSKYQRRIDRFLKYIYSKKKVLLVWFSLTETIDMDVIIENCNKYCQKIGRKIDFVIVENQDDLAHEIQKEQLADNIILYKACFKNAIDLPTANIAAYSKVFGQIFVKKSLKNKLYNVISIQKSLDRKYRIITIFGIKIKIRRKI